MKVHATPLSLLVGIGASFCTRSVTAALDCSSDICICPKRATESCPDLSPEYKMGSSESTCCFYGDNVVVSDMTTSGGETLFTYDGEEYMCSQLPACPVAPPKMETEPTTIDAPATPLNTPTRPSTDTTGFETIALPFGATRNDYNNACNVVEYTGSCRLTKIGFGCSVRGELGSCDCMVILRSEEKIENYLGDFFCDGAPEDTPTTTAQPDDQSASGATGAATLTFAALAASAAVVAM